MQRSLALLGGALLSVAVWLAFWTAPVVVQAAAGPFTCQPVFYEVDSGQLVEVNPTGGASVTIGPAQPTYNAMGYDTANNYLYAISTAAANLGHLLQIADDGSITDLGLPTGLPAGSYVSGDYDSGVGNPDSGDLVISAPSSTWYAINVNATPPTATVLTISGAPSGDDQVDVGNIMYQLNNRILYAINLDTDSATHVTISGLPATGSYGSGWSDQENDIFFSLNGAGDIYQINLVTDSATLVDAHAPITGNNDGASCKLATDTFDTPVANNDSYTATGGQTLTVAAPGVLGNDVGADLTVDTSDTTSPGHGTLTLNSDGSFTYTPTLGYTGSDTFTYSDVDEFGRDSNTATVTITVDPPAPPTTSPESGTTAYETPITLPTPTTTGVGPFTYALASTPPPGDGVATIDPATGAVTFTPAADFFGTVPTFTYTVTDDYGQTSAPADIDVTVSPPPPPPPPTTGAGPGASPDALVGVLLLLLGFVATASGLTWRRARSASGPS
ncbi:MAG: Ig-like domain-containing protein [Candidatus Dormiibacterota bacterium]